LDNNALAIRIIFPSVRVIQVSFNLTGLPASLGKQKSQLIINQLAFSTQEPMLIKSYTRLFRKQNGL